MRKHWLLSAAVLLLLAVPAMAQRITASIRGTVTDATGAVMAGAKVTVKNEGTGLTNTQTTNSSGNYSFSELPVGSYRIEVEAAGFKSEARSKIGLSVAEVRAVDVQLQTGQVSEVVDVEVAAVAVKTVGAEISGLISGEQVRELPLNGRNFIQLTLLQPGVSANQGLNTKDKGLQGGSDISVGGGSTTGNLWLVDGANNNDVGSNRTLLVYPSVDAIEEFKIQRNNYGAEFGQAGGGQINIVTRGGTNDFHGSAYYYMRRDSFNSADYFLEQTNQGAAPLHWDDYGATFGGPILKDKLHFFLSYEKNNDKRSTVRTAQVPTAAERAGDFSNPIPGCSENRPIDPATGQPFPGNVIPANRINQGGLLMMQLMSLPNVSQAGSCNNYVLATPTPIKWDQINARMDWTLSNTTRMMVRYTQDSWTAAASPNGLWGDDPFPVVASDWDQPGKSLVVQLNKNIGSSMVNALTFSYSANKINVTRGGDNPELVQQLTAAIPTAYPADIKSRGGDAQPMANWGSLGNYGGGVLWNQAPWTNNQDLFVLKDDFSAVFGKHFVKAGLLLSTNKKNEEPANTSQESVQVGGTAGYLGSNGYVPGLNTGNNIANWLLQGQVWNTSEIQANLPVQQRWKDYEFYIADSLKISPRVTADFGVRATHFTLPFEARDVFGNFDPATISAAAGTSPCNGMIYVPGKNPCPALGLAGGSDGPNRSLVPTKFLYLAPRVGLAWDVYGNGKMAIRGGGGLFYQRERVSGGLGLGQAPPLSGTASIVRTLDSATPVVGDLTPSYGTPATAVSQEKANPYSIQWNVAVEREIAHNTTMELAYVGSAGRNLLGQVNLNEIRPADRLAFAQTGNGALRPLNGVNTFGAGSNLALWEQNRSSIYHSLQAQLVTRFGHGSQAQASYTWSRAIANTGISNADGPGAYSVLNGYTDSTNPDLDRAVGNNDRTHIFNANLVLALPALENKGSLVRNVFGDWEVTSIVQAATGYPITIFVGVPSGLDGNGGLTGTGFNGNQRPDVVEGVPCTVEGSSETQWLNVNAWTINGHQIGTNGNTSRGSCRGPGFFQWDAALYKNIKVGPRVQLQLRAEVFNVLNTVNFLGTFGGAQQTTWNPQNPVYNTGNPATATTIVSAGNPGGFGELTAAADPRIVQFGVRLRF